jgi:predicted nucleic acid-binding protein
VTQFTVVYDACVLYPAPLRDLLMWLALTDLFRAKWSEAIHDEWTRAVLASRKDLTAQQLQRTRDLMDSHVRDCLVTGYEGLISSLTLPDPNDRHVLAVAIISGADAIVTYNLRDFPDAALAPYGVEALHPDDFILGQLDVATPLVCATVKRHRQSLRHPPKSVDEYLAALDRQGLPQTVTELRRYADLI